MAKATRKPKYVYLFGNKKADGNGSMKPLLGGKGANLAEMTRIGLPVPPGFTITTEVCTYYYAQQEDLSQECSNPQVKDRRREHREHHGQEVRRPGDAAAGVRALRRARFDAGHDGHDPEPRPERPDRRSRWSRPARTRGLPGIATAASSRCTATSSWACRSAPSEDHEPFEIVIEASSTSVTTPDIEDTKLTVADLKELVKRFKALIKERTGKEFPHDPVEAALGRHRRGVRFVDERPRDRLSPQIQHPLRVGHGGQRAGDGLWQHRRQVRLRASRSRAIPPPARRCSTANS